MANGWTPERRARQAVLIRNWKPWERSTGPRTTDGKVKDRLRTVGPDVRAERWVLQLHRVALVIGCKATRQ